jgi:hypothetical protein
MLIAEEIPRMSHPEGCLIDLLERRSILILIVKNEAAHNHQ